jgi:hypothetical protein
VNLELPDIARELGATASRAFANAGGVDLARLAEADPEVRSTVVAPLLGRLGMADLDVDVDPDVAFAAGELCRAAGRSSLPYPVVAVLASRGGDELPVALVDGRTPRADHADLFPEWRMASIGGAARVARPEGDRLGTKLGPFVTDLTVVGPAEAPVDVPLTLTLGAWQILGALERAVELTAAHVTDREQFGQPLAAFQAVQFQLADATVAVHALRELAYFTLWRRSAAPLDRLVDALALRVAALESATQVLRTSHQLHGAVGFCDEHDLSVLTRHLQPLLRLPHGLEASTDQLMVAIAEQGFESLFSTSTAAAG